VFTGMKMIVGDRVHISPAVSVLVIGIVLLTTFAASAVFGNRVAKPNET
jgi:hypothetical protein